MNRVRMTLLALVAIGLVTSGCANVTRLAYNNLDWLLYRKVDRFVDLDSTQKAATKAALVRFHDWHRQTQLPEYAAWLGDFARQVQAGPLSGDDIHRRTDELQVFIDHSVAELLPSTAAILATLSDQQVGELLANIDEERQEYLDEYVEVDDAERRNAHIDSLQDALKPWFGRLDKTQKQWLTDWAETLEPFEAGTARQQQRMREDIARFLAQRQEPHALWQGLSSLVVYRTDDWPEALEAVLDRNQARTYELLARLINESTPKQRQDFLDRLAKFQQDFETLSKPR